ncbi:MAG: hypothetical protein KBT03_04825 [Bacteroidales bacterium]|nr:hypothetical protein [Candidatus Scybalousia scybalohippi]
MRLIDADALIEELKTNPKYTINLSIDYAKLLKIISHHHSEIEKVIKEQPTAYEVDKVVEELENIECASGAYERKCWLDKAIEIVRRGGK